MNKNRKIDIYSRNIDGKYVYLCSTTQYKTCEDALESIAYLQADIKAFYNDEEKINGFAIETDS